MASAKRTSGGFYKRGDTWWIRTDPVDGQRRSTGCRDLEAARRWRIARERIAADPAHAGALVAELGAWIGKFLDVKERDSSTETVGYYEDKLGHFVRVWSAECKLVTIDADKVDAYVKNRREDGMVSDPTISKEVAALVQVLKLAKRSKAYGGDLETLRPPGLVSTSEARTRALSRDEVAAVRAKASEQCSAFVAVCVALGCRRSEAGRLQPADVDLERGRVFIQGTKTLEAARWVPILSPFRALLEEALPHLPLRTEALTSMNHELSKACVRAGVAHASPNDLRRTHATWLLEAGVDRDVIRRLLGHTTTRLVDQVYGRPSPEALALLAEERLSSYRNVTSSEETGVTDGDRTRDNRSHNPFGCSTFDGACEFVAGNTRLREARQRWRRLPVGTFSSHGYWAGRKGLVAA
jgi:integrase